ncbi:MAG: hypothetical protein EOO11_14025 [Chitinophagaceae bacterium]|nr:MAG: hypothetical protein EOO11_14025 [Chitinophagaceae bacterium]
MKKLILSFCGSLSLLAAAAQDTSGLHKALRDPQRHAKEAKADRYVRDSTRISNDQPTRAPKKVVVKSRKGSAIRKACSKKKDPAG